MERLTDYVVAGAADYAQRRPGLHEPEGDPLSPPVVAYWDGWTAAVMDAAARRDRS